MLDKTNWVEGEGLLDLSKPSLQALSHILRHKELWPDEFEWNFADCHHCAMGLAYKLWRDSIESPHARSMSLLGMTINEAYNLFVFPIPPPSPIPWDLTPEYIASTIDQYLAEKV